MTEPLLADRLPISGVSGPTFWVFAAGLGVDLSALFKDLLFPPKVAIGGGDKANRTVEVLGVVPLHESHDPPASLFEGLEGLGGILGAVLERSEKRFRVRVVIADAGPAERGHHTQALEGGEHG